MITGDQGATARTIAESIGIPSVSTLQGGEIERMDSGSEADRRLLLEANVIARATPAQKLSLIRFYQSEGKTVAMTSTTRPRSSKPTSAWRWVFAGPT